MHAKGQLLRIIVRNLEERNVGTKGKSPEQDLTIDLSRDASLLTID